MTARKGGHTVSGPLTIGLQSKRRARVGTFVPSDTRSDLRVSSGKCDGLDGTGGQLFSIPEPNGALGTGNPCYFFPKAPQFVDPRIDKLRFDSTRKIDKTQSAVRGGSDCHTNADITATRSIHATLRVGNGGPDDRGGPTDAERQKAFATSDLLTSLLRAELPCGYAALGAGTALWSSTVGGPTAPAALVPASVLISAGVPLCATYAARIAADINIVNDPPVGNVNKVAKPKRTPSSAEAAAKLASCDSQPADQQAFCAELRTDTADEVAAATKLTAIADALLMTVDRETKARKHHKRRALKRQARAGNKLVKQMRAAAVAEDAAWRKIQTLIAAQGLTGSFTAAQDGTAIGELLKRLKSRGVSRAAANRYAASPLNPAPVDLPSR